MSEHQDWPSTQVSLLHRLRDAPMESDWELFASIYSPLIFRFCRRRLLQEADAHDVAQNVFLAARRGIAQFRYDPGRGKFRSWLGTIAAREIQRYQRRQQRAGQGAGGPRSNLNELAETDADWIVEFNSCVFQAALDRIRNEFDATTWEAFEAVWLNDDSPQTVAARLDRKPDWVYRGKYRVLQRLKTELAFLTDDIAGFSKE